MNVSIFILIVPLVKFRQFLKIRLKTDFIDRPAYIPDLVR